MKILSSLSSTKLVCIIIILSNIISPINVFAGNLSAKKVESIAADFFRESDTGGFNINEVKVDSLVYNRTTLRIFNYRNRWAVLGDNDQIDPIICFGNGSLSMSAEKEYDSPLYSLLMESLYGLDSVGRMDVVFPQKARRTSSSETYVYVEPLLDRREAIEWGQRFNNSWSASEDKTYNKFCPGYHTDPDNTYVGCTAVAMGQVMWYWQWPDHANIPDTIIGCVAYGESTAHYYDWDNMPGAIYNSTDLYQVDAVASLLRDCGYAGHACYTSVGTSMTLTNAKPAMDNIFKYHVGAIVQYTSGASRFTEKLIENLINGRPVIMQASPYNDPESDGIDPHTFVVDGYDELLGKIHINWGWRGTAGTRNTWYNMEGFAAYGYYTIARRFLDAVYPRCDERDGEFSDVDYTQVNEDYAGVEFRVTGADLCTTTPLNIASGGHFIMKSEEYIRIHPGFHAAAGSNVHIFIDEFPCNSTANFIVSLPSTDESDSLVGGLSYESRDVEVPASLVDNSSVMSSAVNELHEDRNSAVEKFFLSGKLYIKKDGHVYNTMGLLIE